MKQNVGSIDKAIRVLVALVMAALYFGNIVTGAIGIVLLVLAAVFTGTAFIGFCPLYLPFGISTKKKEN